MGGDEADIDIIPVCWRYILHYLRNVRQLYYSVALQSLQYRFDMTPPYREATYGNPTLKLGNDLFGMSSASCFSEIRTRRPVLKFRAL